MPMYHFQTYLMGLQFTVEADHRALLWMDRLKGRLTHPFDFMVVHCKGTKNGNADGLLRMPCSEDATNELAAEGGRNVKDCIRTMYIQ